MLHLYFICVVKYLYLLRHAYYMHKVNVQGCEKNMENKISNLFRKIDTDIKREIARDREIEKIIYDKMRTYEFPFLVMKQYGRNSGHIDYTPIVGKHITYHPPKTMGIDDAGILYGSSMLRIKDGNLRLASKELQDQLIGINDQIHELELKKRELLEQHWSRLKKLSWQKAEEYNAIRKELWNKNKEG